MSSVLSPVIAATTRWLVGAYPADGGELAALLARAQARQAVTVAAWLRYPTTTDAALLILTGPGGSADLDRRVGARPSAAAWRGWVDEVVAGWAASLLTEPALAREATAAVVGCEHAGGLVIDFPRLTEPDGLDRRAAALLRHPDLLHPVAAPYRIALSERLTAVGALNRRTRG
ncbi:hypothetical protein E1265_34650 [Streptomyces sp. 8K308]|uniref:hypothetical protein n=1 Tax=Streptomyces sp. 8K308 TaxID=2530388 RepID=UPI001053662D|nr:hypothetical protein [Streptomyces sp. 8K308]TDC06606.1 hypothetical protein E1265_34650 [Streptomyces sp. 8K308]